MADKETVVKWLEKIVEDDWMWKHADNYASVISDALTLLNETAEAEIEGSESTWWYVCGECRTAIDRKDKYCRECGRKLTWE